MSWAYSPLPWAFHDSGGSMNEVCKTHPVYDVCGLSVGNADHHGKVGHIGRQNARPCGTDAVGGWER